MIYAILLTCAVSFVCTLFLALALVGAARFNEDNFYKHD